MRGDPSDYRVRISPGSTMAKVEERLRDSCSVEFLVTENFDILLHHSSSHLDLLEDSGIAACDISVIGNLSLAIGIYEFRGRSACCRFKGSEAGADVCNAADRAINAFLKPLAEKVRSEAVAA